MRDATRLLEPFVEGWAGYQPLLLGAIGPLDAEQLSSRTAPFQWAVWQLAAHMAARARTGSTTSSARATGAFERTWAMIDECPRRLGADDLEVEVSRTRRNGQVEMFTRAWVVGT